MALINCRKCGKRISDTSPNCIHCGELIKASPLSENPIHKSGVPLADKIAESLPHYEKLSEEEQTKLESEFLKNDKESMKYRRKGKEAKKFASYVFWLLLVARLLLLLQRAAINNLFNGVVLDAKMVEMATIFIVSIVFIWVASIVFSLYSIISYRSKTNRLLYYKKFQKWLREKKAILYVPNLMSEKDRRLFENINLDKYKF